MLDESGNILHEALPSRPVQVLGLTAVPGAGDNFLVVEDDRVARQIAERRSARDRNALLSKRRVRVSIEDIGSAFHHRHEWMVAIALKSESWINTNCRRRLNDQKRRLILIPDELMNVPGDAFGVNIHDKHDGNCW